jgi:hypothetical protein
MEVTAACNGFTFKETLMSENPVTDPANPKKVLGLIWNMSAEELQMDVKVNFSRTKKGS